ncbi:MAG: glycosyltransferase WbuB [Planctomycetes bacterium]|nr:glycosyltransferase WbuB [Planctomycetota bacterium]HJO27224.1 glycosyltransferase family 4 protein [Planctomycetota bacterium]
MRILYHHRTAAEDGQAVHIRSMLRAFRATGHQVEEVALVRRGDGTVAAGDPGAPEARRAAPGSPTAASASARSESGDRWSLWEHLPRFLRELAEYGYTASARRRLRARGREWRPDFIYERYAFGNAGGLQAARALGVPLVLEVNSPMVHELSCTRGLSFPRLARRMEGHILQSADLICAVSDVLAGMLVELGADPARIIVTPNGVDLADFDNPQPAAARAALGLGKRAGAAADAGAGPDLPHGPVLGFVGYLRDWHRLDLVVEALARPSLSAAHLVVIGTGPAIPALEAQAQDLGLGDRLHLAGPRPHGQIPALLPAFDIGLVPAINPYASPLKLHEYMAASLAVIAPDQPNLREVLTAEEDALLVPPGDGEALATTLERLARDPALVRSLGEEARRTVETRELTWDGNARRVCAAVEECL